MAPTINKIDLLYRLNFAAFVHRAFEVLYPGRTLRPNWHIDAACNYLQEVAEGRKSRFLVLNMPPRSLKTFIVSNCLPAWLLVRNPSMEIIVASYADRLSGKGGRDFRALMESDFVSRLSRGNLTEPRKSTETEFETRYGGGCYWTSVGGTLTGRGGDFIIIDDPLKAGEAASPVALQAVNDWFSNTLFSRRNQPGITPVILSMQRLHVDDLAGMLIEKGWPSLVLPAIAVEDELFDLGAGAKHHRRKGDLLQPGWDNTGGLEHGDWVSPVDLADGVLCQPKSHQASFRGGRPHDSKGRELKMGTVAVTVHVADGFDTSITFSFKLKDGDAVRDYRSFEEKVLTYLDAITEPALAAYPDATPLKAIEKMAKDQGSPLRFPDTLSAKYNMNDISDRLRGKMAAIIGAGGTGAYILDFIAKTHLQRIALFDDDTVYVDTIFRIPGCIHRAIGQQKVDALAQQYANWHSGIEAVPELVTERNIGRLAEFDFVFVAIDDGAARLFIIDWLTAKSIPFVDCGMGLNRVLGGLNGTARITGVDRAAFEKTAGTVNLPISKTKEDEYRKQAQIGELNALAAAMAVIRFKQHFGLFDREDESVSCVFETTSFDFDPKIRPK